MSYKYIFLCQILALNLQRFLDDTAENDNDS